MQYNDTINAIIKKNDKLLLHNRELKFDIFIKNILLSTSILANILFIYRLRKN